MVLLPNGEHISLIDLPGVYSLSPRSEDERITHDVLTGSFADTPKPNAILLILDSTNLGRQLMLAAPILDLGIPTLVVLNMADELKGRGGQLDLASLSDQLGTPVVLISARHGQGVEKVMHFLSNTFSAPKPLELPVLNLSLIHI